MHIGTHTSPFETRVSLSECRQHPLFATWASPCILYPWPSAESLMLMVVQSFWVQGDSARIASPILLGPDLLLSPSTSALANTHECCGKTWRLFQRLILVAGGVVDNVEDIFKYEPCTYPVALFDASGFLREANKPPLADAMWAVPHGDETHFLCEDESTSMTNVLVGGSLLKRLRCQNEVTFIDLCQSYVDYVRMKYGTPIIEFDGYDTIPSTKDMRHLSRTRCAVRPQVNFNGGIPSKSTKEHFLTNHVSSEQAEFHYNAGRNSRRRWMQN